MARHRQTGGATSSPVVRQVATDQLLRFAGVGVVSTLGYLFLFVAWRPLAGTLGANALALAICTIFNTAVHRELARGADGQPRRGRYVAIVAALLAASLTLTTLSLLAADLLSPTSLLLEVGAVTVANAVAALLRFAVLRAWVFRPAAPIDSLEVST
jgi:putative flippase GtrA